MDAYTGFAYVYDTFMDNIPYEEWCQYVTELLKEYGIENGLITDLGCGTGKFTRLLVKEGYDLIGIDCSENMLSIAREKTDENILYLLQDMREFELYGTVAAVVSICDSMNYLLEEEDLVKVFSLVNNYLDPGGIFIFDLNTPYKYEKILSDNTIAENREDASFIWDNYYYKEEQINEYDLTIYVKESMLEEGAESKHQRFLRFDETHYQRAYSLDTIKILLQKAGMEFITAYDAFTKEPPKEDSERIYVIARETHQKNKLYLNEKN